MESRSLWSIFLLVLALIQPLWANEISCINDDGKAVDWYILYKLPKFTRYEAAGTGLQYMFLDSLTQAWKLSKYLVNTTEGALGQTLQQLYVAYKSKKNYTAYVIYSDSPPSKMNYSWTHGHSKGFLLLDKSQGFWIIHSIPAFPPFPKDGYGYPPPGKKNGQTVICLTFQYNQFTEIDKQLSCYNPNIYNCSIPQIFQPELFNMQILCAGSELPPVPWKYHLSKLQTAQGETLLSFAKTQYYHEDIYLAWMAQRLETDFLIESWRHQGHELFSNCSFPYHVYNIKFIETPWNSSFSSYYDHSKWCVSRSSEDQWTCIGDLNHAAPQAKRSGGFICTQNQYIYNAFRRLVLSYYDCHKFAYGYSTEG